MTWIEDNKGTGPWPFTSQADMTWIEDNKGTGPWPFTLQADRPHYNQGNLISDHDNPVWKMDFSGNPVTPVHHPWCGYWTKDYTPDPPADIFVINWSGAPTIYGVSFDGRRLKWIGKYQPPGVDLNGLILYEGDLLTIADVGGAYAGLRRISTTAVNKKFPLIEAYNPFNSYDVRTVANGRLVNGDSGKFYYSDTTTVMVSVHDLVRDKRGFRNTVITGTDGNLYVLDAVHFWWVDSLKPVTGANWSTFWNLIEDNICDSTVTAWNGEIKKCSSCLVDICYHDGYLYTADYSSIVSPLTKINPLTLETEATYAGLYLNRITVYNDKIYAIGGVTTVTAYIFNASDLSLICSMALPDGRAIDGDLEVVGNYLIVSATSYADPNGTLYKLSLDDLTILDSILSEFGTDIIGGQQLAGISDTYVAVGWNNGVSVYNIESMNLVDRLSIGGFVEVGYHAQAMVVKHS